MSSTIPKLATFVSMAWRGVLGAVAGALLALFALPWMRLAISSYYGPEDDFGWLLRVAGLGALLGAGLGMIAGGWKVRGVAKFGTVGVVTGCIVGSFAGIIFGIAAPIPPDMPKEFRGKVMASHQGVGILFGVPAGSILGGLVGVTIGVARKLTANYPSS